MRPPPNTRPRSSSTPNTPMPHNNLGYLLAEPGQARRGRRRIQEPRSSSTPNPPRRTTVSAMSSPARASPTRPPPNTRTAIQLDPKCAWPHNNLGSLLDDQGKPDEAAAEYDNTRSSSTPNTHGRTTVSAISSATRASPTRPPPNTRTRDPARPRPTRPATQRSRAMSSPTRARPDEAAAEYRKTIQARP